MPPIKVVLSAPIRTCGNQTFTNRLVSRQAPKNAGPINSHVVALRSLALMRDTSPDYLNRFMSYVDTLLCLDQGDKAVLPAAKPPRAVKPTKK